MGRIKLIYPVFLYLISCIIPKISTPFYLLNTFFDVLGDAVILLFCIDWFVDISMHITNRKTGIYLKTVCGFCMFWILTKSLKWNFFSSADSAGYRFLWYAYYIPIVFLPLLSLYISLYTGKLPDYKPDKKFKLLYIPALALIILVLTNDFHNLVFKFPESGNYDNYSYGIGHNITVLWTFVLIIVFLGILYRNSRIPESKHRTYIPFIPVLFISLYCVMYPLLRETLFYKAFNLVPTAIMSVFYIYGCCCYVGLISYNGNYDRIFRNSSVNAFITDADFNIKFKSKTNTGISAKPENFNTDSDNFVLKRSKINEGYVFWIEDITEINRYIEELNETGELLKNENDILKADFNIKSQNEKIKKKIELYNEINSAVKPQLDRIEALTRSGRCNTETLTDICFSGVLIKRKSNLLLLNENSKMLSTAELYMSIKESLNYAGLYNIEYGLNAKTEKTVPGILLIRAYNWFGDVLGSSIKNLSYIYVTSTEDADGFTLTLLTEDKNGVTDNKSRVFNIKEAAL